MKIAVIGAGAIGGLVAGYLKDKGEDVFLVGRKDAVTAIGKEGLQISGVRGNFKIKVGIIERLNEKVDLIILAVKTQDIEKAIEENKKYFEDTQVLITQNGVAAEELVAKYIGNEKIVSSIVMFGATYLEPGKVVHNFEGKWVLGAYGRNNAEVKKVACILGKAFFVEITDEIAGMKWLKVFVNANNCIPAIVGKSMQECFANLDLCEIGIGIWQEGLGAVDKAGIKLVSLPDFGVERITKLTSLPIKEAAKIFSGIMVNLSKEPLYGSILQSIKRHRPSEIDYINGAFVALGRAHTYHTPLNKKLVELVHKVERDKKFLKVEELIAKLKNLLPRQAQKEGEERVNTPFPRLKLTVTKVEGDCYHGYKIGDEIILEDFTHPPKHFCLGLAHVLFPIIYALSFGAKFPFQNNQRSLEVTCPDGGKLAFKVEIFDKEGKIETIEKDHNFKGPQPKDMVLEVVKSTGKCSYGYKLGDKFDIKGLRCPQDFCGAAFHTAFPAIFALNFGAKFFFMDDPEGIDTVTCPDGGKIVFKVSRKK